MNIPNIFPPSSKDDEGSSGGSGDLSISDVIGKERIISIFAGFTRDINSISKRLNDNEQNTTVLAPLNSALQKLLRKPWEDPEDYNELGATAYEGSEGEDRATRNLRRFAEAHIVPVSPWKEGEKLESMDGGQVWWEEKDGNKVVGPCRVQESSRPVLILSSQIQPGNIEVSEVAQRVSNGEIWVVKECLNYA